MNSDRAAPRREGEASGDPFDVVCLSHLRWGFIFQRPQHLLTRWAREGRVFYIEEPVATDGPARLDVKLISDRVWAAVPHIPDGTPGSEADDIQRRLIEELLGEHQVERYILWMYTPMALPLVSGLRPLATVYDCMDELSAFEGAPAELLDRERELFEAASLVFTGGESLYERKRGQHENVYLFPSSVDIGHFAQARELSEDPPDQAAIPHPRVGYAGVIDERMDLDLVGAVARLRPDMQFVMLGPVLKIDPAHLPELPNIHYLGRKGYDELPRYLAGWDVAMMPFAHNESTRYISPTKTPEYLAAGKPVVSTSIRDVVHPYGELELVRIADDPSGFAAALEACLSDRAHEDRIRASDEFLSQTSWDRTWQRMRRLVGDVISSKDADILAPDSDPAASPTNGSKPTISLDHRPPGRTDVPYDYLIAGAGFAGSVLAQRFASAGKRVVVVERRTHIGGNAFDEYDEAGILIHRYGPHIFHTNSREVFEYLSRFTAWRQYEHRVLASVDGMLVPIPINLDTINTLYGLSLSSQEMEGFLASLAEDVDHVKTSEDVVVGKVGRELYVKFFRGYTRKQWGLDPSELDATVTSRVPVRTNRDPRYFSDTYQAMPLHGYTRMFERMLDHPNIRVLLNTEFREAATFVPHREVVFTGPVDEFFGHRFGRLPYRSLEFRFETHERPVHQPAPVVNFPNEHLYTRSTEFKYLTGQEHGRTTLVYEYPRSDGDPYYPVPQPQNAALYRRYKELAEKTPRVHFVGRLATYRYYNMDQVVAQALSVASRLLQGALDGARVLKGNEVSGLRKTSELDA